MEAVNNKCSVRKVPECAPNSVDKNNNFNFLRLFFAYMVVVFHSVELSGHSYPLSRFFDGYIAIYGFFVISGFLIIRSYWVSTSLGDYYIKRCKRLLPAYFIAVTICVVFLSLYSTLSVSEYFRSSQTIKYYISNILFMNFLQPSLPGVFGENKIQAVNGSLWTIKIEICFYIMVPVIGYFINKLKTKLRINAFLCVLYGSGYLYKFICLYIYEKTGNGFLVELSRQLPGVIQYFAVGIFCAINYDLMQKWGRYLIVPAIITVMIFYVTGNQWLLPVALGVIVMYVGFNFQKLNSVGKMGDYSYGVYIFHFPIIQILVSLGYFELNKNITLSIVIGIVFSVSYISWHFLEKRVLKR